METGWGIGCNVAVEKQRTAYAGGEKSRKHAKVW